MKSLLHFLTKIGLVRQEGIFYIGGSDVLPAPLKGKEELEALEALENRTQRVRQRQKEAAAHQRNVRTGKAKK